MPLSREESRRSRMVPVCEVGKITTSQIIEALGLSARQLWRLRAWLRMGGPAVLAYGHRGRPWPRALPAALRPASSGVARKPGTPAQ